MMERENNIKYYLLKNDDNTKTYIRLINGVNLECLNTEFEWAPNQEWYISFFVEGDEEVLEVSQDEVNKYIEEQLNLGKMTR